MKPRALDLFCGAGGASRGLADAGYEVYGVDIAPQPNYPFQNNFKRMSAFDVNVTMMREFDLIWASPPCQGRTAYKRRPNHVKPVDTDGNIARIRERLQVTNKKYIIENVPGAPLIDPITLCGSMFDLEVRRHRIFECSFKVEQPRCKHQFQNGDFPQATNRKNRRKTCEVGVWRIPLEVQQRAMGGVGWMTLEELSESIPPRYAHYLGNWSR